MLSPNNIRGLILAALLAAAQISWCGDRSAESVTVIQRAVERSELRIPELAPFKLRAEIQAEDLNSKPLTGVYELTWASPTRWREEIRLAGYTETRIGGKAKVWQFPTRSFEAQRIRNVARKFAVREELSFVSAESISEPKKREVEGKQVLCVKVKSRDTLDQEYCFDPASGVLLRSRSGHEWFEYLEYQRAGAQSFPFRLVKGGKDVVRVLELRTNIQPEPGLSEPPPGITAAPGCEYPKVPKGLKLEDPPYPRGLRGTSAQVTIFGLVGADGAFRELQVIRSGGPEADSATLTALSKWTFRPAVCDDMPVPFTIEVVMHFDVY